MFLNIEVCKLFCFFNSQIQIKECETFFNFLRLNNKFKINSVFLYSHWKFFVCLFYRWNKKRGKLNWYFIHSNSAPTYISYSIYTFYITKPTCRRSYLQCPIIIRKNSRSTKKYAFTMLSKYFISSVPLGNI